MAMCTDILFRVINISVVCELQRLETMRSIQSIACQSVKNDVLNFYITSQLRCHNVEMHKLDL